MTITGKDILLVFSGLLCGAGASAFFFKKHYEAIANEEIKSVKETYCVRKMPEPAKNDEPKKDILKPSSKVQKPSYFDQGTGVNYSFYSVSKEENTAARSSRHIIPPEEFAMEDEYETASLIYYSDGILADSDDRELKTEDIEDMVGVSSLDHFGEYEADSVFVRNDQLHMDFEIIRDHRRYLDAIAQDRPYRLEER